MPYYIISYYQKYISYGIVFLHKSESVIRLCGICNEPGLFGTISALVLCANGLNLKDKKNIIIFIAGILSFSVAFFIIIFAYYFIKNINKVQNIFILLFIILFFGFVAPNIKTNNNSINYIMKRLSISEFVGKIDSRSSEEVNDLLKNTLKTRPLFGMGHGYIEALSLGDSVLIYKTYLIAGTMFFSNTITLSYLNI